MKAFLRGEVGVMCTTFIGCFFQFIVIVQGFFLEAGFEIEVLERIICYLHIATKIGECSSNRLSVFKDLVLAFFKRGDV